MQVGAAHIGTAGHFPFHSVTQAFELTLAYIFKQRAVGPGSGSFVEIDGDCVAVPDCGSGLAGKEHALIERDIADRHERYDVSRTDARVNAALGGKIDELGGSSRSTNSGFNDRGRRPGDRHDRAVVVWITGEIEQRYTVDGHGSDDGFNDGRVAAFGEIGHAFDER